MIGSLNNYKYSMILNVDNLFVKLILLWCVTGKYGVAETQTQQEDRKQKLTKNKYKWAANFKFKQSDIPSYWTFFV